MSYPWRAWTRVQGLLGVLQMAPARSKLRNRHPSESLAKKGILETQRALTAEKGSPGGARVPTAPGASRGETLRTTPTPRESPPRKGTRRREGGSCPDRQRGPLAADAARTGGRPGPPPQSAVGRATGGALAGLQSRLFNHVGTPDLALGKLRAPGERLPATARPRPAAGRLAARLARLAAGAGGGDPAPGGPGARQSARSPPCWSLRGHRGRAPSLSSLPGPSRGHSRLSRSPSRLCPLDSPSKSPWQQFAHPGDELPPTARHYPPVRETVLGTDRTSLPTGSPFRQRAPPFQKTAP
nr:translation initiation factor IF-2-like [Equus asinus]